MLVVISDIYPGDALEPTPLNTTLTSWSTAASAAIGSINVRESSLDYRNFAQWLVSRESTTITNKATVEAFAEEGTESVTTVAGTPTIVPWTATATQIKCGPITFDSADDEQLWVQWTMEVSIDPAASGWSSNAARVNLYIYYSTNGGSSWTYLPHTKQYFHGARPTDYDRQEYAGKVLWEPSSPVDEDDIYFAVFIDSTGGVRNVDIHDPALTARNQTR